MSKVKTPECDKMLKVHEKSQEIGNFLNWLREEKEVCFMTENPDWREGRNNDKTEYLYFHFNMEELLAEYFKIDLKKVETERQAILKSLRDERND